MNGAIFPFCDHYTIAGSQKGAKHQAIPIARTGFRPEAIMPAIKALLRASVEPTEKVNPPVMMTKVIPKAIRAFVETCLVQQIGR